MPKIKLTKSAIDALKPTATDEVYWDATLPGFGVKVTPKGRKVFIALYRVRGGKSRLRKYTIGPYGKLTLHHARATAQRVFAERFDGRDPAAEKLDQRRREVADRVDDLIEAFAAEHLSTIRSGRAIARQLRREVTPAWGHRSIHEITRRDISSLVFQVAAQRTPNSAHRLLKGIKRFFSWCLGRAILIRLPPSASNRGIARSPAIAFSTTRNSQGHPGRARNRRAVRRYRRVPRPHRAAA